MHGVNAKRWFYGLRSALRGDKSVSAIMAGAACEQWVNGQLFSVIASGLRSTQLTAYPEWNRRQHDCAVFHVPPGKNPVAEWDSPVAVVETKLLYLNYRHAKRERYVARVLQQLAAPSTATRRVGFILGVYAWWMERGHPPETFREFRRNVGAVIREQVGRPPAGFRAEAARGAVETILPEGTERIGASRALVGCVGQYVILTPEAYSS